MIKKFFTQLVTATLFGIVAQATYGADNWAWLRSMGVDQGSIRAIAIGRCLNYPASSNANWLQGCNYSMYSYITRFAKAAETPDELDFDVLKMVIPGLSPMLAIPKSNNVACSAATVAGSVHSKDEASMFPSGQFCGPYPRYVYIASASKRGLYLGIDKAQLFVPKTDEDQQLLSVVVLGIDDMDPSSRTPPYLIGASVGAQQSDGRYQAIAPDGAVIPGLTLGSQDARGSSPRVGMPICAVKPNQSGVKRDNLRVTYIACGDPSAALVGVYETKVVAKGFPPFK